MVFDFSKEVGWQSSKLKTAFKKDSCVIPHTSVDAHV